MVFGHSLIRRQVMPSISKERGIVMTKTTITDLAFMFTGFLFIMALPASFALLANGYDLLSLAVFMTGGLAFLSSMAAMLMTADK